MSEGEGRKVDARLSKELHSNYKKLVIKTQNSREEGRSNLFWMSGGITIFNLPHSGGKTFSGTTQYIPDIQNIHQSLKYVLYNMDDWNVLIVYSIKWV